MGETAAVLSAGGAALVAVLGAFLKVVRSFLQHVQAGDARLTALAEGQAALQAQTNDVLREATRALGDTSAALRAALQALQSSGSGTVVVAASAPEIASGGKR